MKRLLLTIVLIIAVTMLSGFSKKPKEIEAKSELSNLEMSNFESGMQRFGFDLLKQSVSEKKDNVFISPFSISQALSMLINGAEGKTREEIASLFDQQNLDPAAFNLANQNRVSALSADESVEINIANSIWYRKEMSVEKPFLMINSEFYNAEISGLDFDDPTSSTTINNWVAEQTKDKITQIVKKELDPMLMMLLVNAVYFKGQWEKPFLPSRTRKATFDDRMTCQMMSIKESYPYFYDKEAQVIDLPYGDGNYSMLVALPDETSSLNKLVERLDADMWSYWLKNLKMTDGSLQLPTFEMEYEVNLNNILKNLGMSKAFAAGDAEFAKISKETELFVSKVLHKTYLKVDEEGTEAAAVTSVGMETTSIKPAGFIMNVNRPFICIIHQKGDILFMGLINNPEIKE